MVLPCSPTSMPCAPNFLRHESTHCRHNKHGKICGVAAQRTWVGFVLDSVIVLKSVCENAQQHNPAG